MKKKLLTLMVGIIGVSLFSCNAIAQNPKNTNSEMNRALADTTFLRAVEVTLKPGEKTDLHTHPANFFYALTAGKLMVHYKDGKEQAYDLKPGMAGVEAPEGPHITENTGKTTVKFIVVEIKDHPYQAGK